MNSLKMNRIVSTSSDIWAGNIGGNGAIGETTINTKIEYC